ncbi:helix-turn-helix transcriptional regulator [Streptomyces viridosporus]|uniref:helix-turn-helix transcriptional regulator n=1 Tax=Streptomyces viridosporus TaxID=67581 RepID=UPI0021006389|nr:LuxR family transcriptional regulator [Streptomyces viridosporus]
MKTSTLKTHGEDLMSTVIGKPSPGESTVGPADGTIDTVEGVNRMESALLQARALIESTMSLHRTRPVRESLVLRADDADIGGTVTRLVGLARHSVSVSLSAGENASAVFDALAAHATPSKERAAGGGTGGPVIRLLCTPQAVNNCGPNAEDFRGTRCEIRVDDRELRGMLIVDSRVALVPGFPGKAGDATIIKDTASARALDLLFAGMWANAQSLAEYQRTSARMRTESVRRILEQLCEGHTDEVAARELRVSLRTYRRHVAEIMQTLGANSRFQAGVRAVEMALLPQRTDVPARESGTETRGHG